MSPNPAQPASSAYAYPLLIRQLLHTPLATAPHQEIVYADKRRYDYRTFAERVARLASALTALGVKPGDTVAVMDWDSQRYLECFFAVPMMGAVLHTINVRLSPEQILYTINHAEDDVILVHQDFLPILEQIRDRLERPCKFLLIQEQSVFSMSVGLLEKTVTKPLTLLDCLLAQLNVILVLVQLTTNCWILPLVTERLSVSE